MEIDEQMTALLSFDRYGTLRTISLNASDEHQQKVLRTAVERLIQSNHKSWIKRLLEKCKP